MEILVPGIFLAAVLSLDITHAFQTMISQPIFSCTILGVIFGHPEVGLVFGIVFELIFLKSLPVGASAFPENSMAGMTTSVLAIALIEFNPQFQSQYIAMCILLGLIFSQVGTFITIYHRKWNMRFLNKVKIQQSKGKVRSRNFLIWILISMGHYVLSMFLSALIFCAVFYHAILVIPDEMISKIPAIPEVFWILSFSLIGIVILFPVYFRKGGE